MSRQKIVVLSGAGISAESGIKTFRDHDGLWEGHDVMEVASPQGWHRNMELVLEFYNQRRRQLKEVSFNSAHKNIAALEAQYDVVIVTQNVDNLHEKAGSSTVLHLHGQLDQARSTKNPNLIYDWSEDINVGDKCELGSQLRPHIVWFGESVPMIEQAAEEVMNCNICIVVGTSLQVYPAAGLISYVPKGATVYYIDPKPFISRELESINHEVIAEKATIGTKSLLDILIS